MARRARLIDLAWYVGMGLFLPIFLSPIIWVYLASLTPSDRLAGSPYAVLDARHYTFAAFPRVWNGFGFSQAFTNSLLVCLAAAVCVVLLCSLPAYALSRYGFRGRNELALAILLGQLVPGIVVVIPIVLLLRNIHLTDNLVGLAGVYVIGAIPLGVWMLRGFLDAIPRELDESVLVDGGGLFAVLRYVIFPLAQPGIVTVAAFTFISAWGEYLLALSLITSNQNWTLPLALQEAFSRNSVDLGALTAGGVIASLPVAVLFMVVQRSLVAGLAAGSVKG
jgi:ABC-type glycerol-3-phosphate transport system permease component